MDVPCPYSGMECPLTEDEESKREAMRREEERRRRINMLEYNAELLFFRAHMHNKER